MSPRQLWDETLNEPVPERFTQLLNRLENAPAFDGNGEPGGVGKTARLLTGADGEAGSRKIPRPDASAPHNRVGLATTTPPVEQGSGHAPD